MNTDNSKFEAGKAAGQAQEKGNQVMDKAGKAAQTTKESAMEAGKQVQIKTQEAVDHVKDAAAPKK